MRRGDEERLLDEAAAAELFDSQRDEERLLDEAEAVVLSDEAEAPHAVNARSGVGDDPKIPN